MWYKAIDTFVAIDEDWKEWIIDKGSIWKFLERDFMGFYHMKCMKTSSEMLLGKVIPFRWFEDKHFMETYTPEILEYPTI